MKDRRQWIPFGGLLVIAALVGYMVVQLNAQAAAVTADFRKAVTAQVRDARGQVVLEGPFAAVEEDDDDIERKATLAPIGGDADAAGQAEVEFAKTAATEQDVEFSVQNVEAGAAFTFWIDGTEVGSAKADRRGRAEAELTVKIP
jgi:hypothetical protein